VNALYLPMNPVQRAVLAAVEGKTPEPIRFKKVRHVRWQPGKKKVGKKGKTRKPKGPNLSCKVLPGETAAQALQRCLNGGSMKRWYREVYLLSDHWKALRAEALKLSTGHCADCGMFAMSLDVHHLAYRNIFDVTTADLAALCRPCHDLRHSQK
jgi:hypothetical protein